MPERSRVAAFVAAVVAGAHVQAIADYYHEDASMQENDKPPRRGRDRLMRHEAEFLERVQRMATHPAKVVLVDGDHVVINWVFDMTDANGTTRRLEELSLQRWRGDRILEERFFYDTATAWRPVQAPAGN